jgi:exopolyphosphatase / guanosine-5'-triphosphate,3'-diphosphate pyrophosphatase
MTAGDPTIVPRWEWRTFGRRFGDAEAAFAALDQEAIQESDELYFVSRSGANVKVRGDLLDIKVLEDVDANGLEQWMPVMKVAFPLSRADTAATVDAMGIVGVDLDRDSYSLEQFVEELVEPHPAVRVAPVHKRRVRYTVGGCTAEVSDVVVDGLPIRTIAIESEDPDAVLDAVREVGLGGYRNINYQQGLARVIDGTPDRYAVIDVGTNSVKLHVAQRSDDRSWRTMVDRAEMTRLGEGLDDTGIIGAEPLARTAAAIAGMVEEANEQGVLAIAAVGTAGFRMADNRDDVVDAIRSGAGVTIEVLSGEEESRLAYMATQSGLGLGAGSRVVFDTGGGSTEFTFGRADEVDERFSLGVGAVRYAERFGLDEAVTEEVLGEALAAIDGDLSRIDDHRSPPPALIGMGGTVTNLAAVKHAMSTYDPEVIHGTVLDAAEVDRQIELYRTRGAGARDSIPGLQRGRAPVILAGACIVRTIMDRLGAGSFTVSDRGLRHGVLAERFG